VTNVVIVKEVPCGDYNTTSLSQVVDTVEEAVDYILAKECAA